MKVFKILFLPVCLIFIQLLISCEDQNSDTLKNGLLAFYNFNDNILDQSGNGNNGIAFGGNYNFEIGGNKSYDFNGNGDYIKINNDPMLNPSNSITISLWFRPVDFYGIGNNALVVKPFTSHDPPYYQYIMGISGSKGSNYTFGFSLNVNGEFKIIGTETNAWKEGNWYHIVGMYDGKALKLYVNGILENTLVAEGSMSIYNTDLFIARQPNLDVTTPGTIDDLRIYNRALSEEEIAKLYEEVFK
jgi:hypothetical protein